MTAIGIHLFPKRHILGTMKLFYDLVLWINVEAFGQLMKRLIYKKKKTEWVAHICYINLKKREEKKQYWNAFNTFHINLL